MVAGTPEQIMMTSIMISILTNIITLSLVLYASLILHRLFKSQEQFADRLETISQLLQEIDTYDKHSTKNDQDLD